MLAVFFLDASKFPLMKPWRLSLVRGIAIGSPRFDLFHDEIGTFTITVVP
jgi:hypothetical protein